VEFSNRIGLLEEGVLRFVWRGKEYDSSSFLNDPLQCGRDSGRWRSPHQKHRIHAIQTSIERVRNSEISVHQLNLWRHTGPVRLARHRAHSNTRTG